MATIRKRGNSYQIRVSCGYDTNGAHVEQAMTWKPDKKMTEKQIQKELNRIAVKFEEDCMSGYTTATMKFEDFGEVWFHDYAEPNLSIQTVRTYNSQKKRLYSSFGHLRLDKITVRTIQKFERELADDNLSPKTISNYLALTSSIFDYAVRLQMISANPCQNVTKPKIKQKEKDIYTLEEVQRMLELFEQESETNFKYVIFFTLAAFTGLRRGELLGLEWKDIDFEHCLISVERASQWTKERGIYTDTTKTAASKRIIKIPEPLAEELKRYKAWQDDYKASIGSKWIEHDRLFTKINGEPMGLRSPYKYYEKFCKRTGMRFVSPHSFRHFNASALILNNIDVKTVQGCLGHKSPLTTLQIYAHSFQKAQAMAMDSVADFIYGKDKIMNKAAVDQGA